MEISGRKEMDGMEDRGEMVCLARMDDVGNEEGEEEERKSVQTGSNREGEVGRGRGVHIGEGVAVVDGGRHDVCFHGDGLSVSHT